MCGRYSLTVDQEALTAALEVEVLFRHEPRYNIAPTQTVPVVVREEGSRLQKGFRWGLVPGWADDPSIGNRMINARGETAAEKPSFRVPFRRRRCLVPADGFYEWKKEDGGKVPFWIHREGGGILTFAGLWDRWEGEDGHALETFTIVTTEANELLRPIHRRMPVILSAGGAQRWLDPAAGRSELQALLARAPSEVLDVREVSTHVNSPSHDDPGCIQPVGEG